MVSVAGRSGIRQGSQTPHLSAVLPIDAYSLAVSCSSRGVSLSTSGPPAFRHPPYRALSVFQTRQVHSPSRTTRRATTWFPPRRALCPAGAGSLPRLGGPPGRRGTPPSARYREYGVRCLAMRRRPSTAAALQRGTRSALSVLPSRRALRPGHVACGDRCVRAPYHRVITLASTIFLAKPLARLAARPHLRPVTTAAAPPAAGRGRRLRPLRAARAVVTGAAPRTAQAERRAGRIAPVAVFAPVRDGGAKGALPIRALGGGDRR